jgi:hypothetical protein
VIILISVLLCFLILVCIEGGKKFCYIIDLKNHGLSHFIFPIT